MSQVYTATKPESGVTTFGGLYQIIRDHFAAVISQFSGVAFPASPVQGQVCWRTDRGLYGYAYVYTGNVAVGESGWLEDATLTTIGIEVIAARGSAASLDARLDVALNEDGTLKAATTLNPSEWAQIAGTVTYVNTTTFTMVGDKTALYYAKRRVKANLAAGAAYSEVVSATYSAPDTTVVILNAVLTNPITSVDISLFAPTAYNGAMSLAMLGLATAAEIITGTEPGKAIAPDQLRASEATAAEIITGTAVKLITADQLRASEATAAEIITGTAIKLITADRLRAAGIISQWYLHIQDQKAQNTQGGTFTTGAWRTRVLNTVVTNDITGASLASNQITLPAGTYRVDITAPAYAVAINQAMLKNITDNSVTIYGEVSISAAAGTSYSRSRITGRFTIAAQKVFEVQHICNRTEADDGLGLCGNFGTEIYTDVQIWKEVTT